MRLTTPLTWISELARHPVIGPYWRLTRMDKPVGTLLILWPTLASLWIAGAGRPDIDLIIIFVLGTFVMRSAGCAINDYADRHIDGDVSRTAVRPLATGELRPNQALGCFIVLCLIAFGLVLLTNLLTIALSFVGAALAAIYPFMKRITHLPQVWLGLAMNWGLVMAYSAQAGELHPGIAVFYAGTIAWTVAYDCFYAMVDRDDDLKLGVKSIAILLGEHDRAVTAGLQLICLFALYMSGQRFELGGFFLLISVGGTALLFAYQQYLIRYRQREACFKAFMNNRWVALVIFIGVVVDLNWPIFVNNP